MWWDFALTSFPASRRDAVRLCADAQEERLLPAWHRESERAPLAPFKRRCQRPDIRCVDAAIALSQHDVLADQAQRRLASVDESDGDVESVVLFLDADREDFERTT